MHGSSRVAAGVRSELCRGGQCCDSHEVASRPTRNLCPLQLTEPRSSPKRDMLRYPTMIGNVAKMRRFTIAGVLRRIEHVRNVGGTCLHGPDATMRSRACATASVARVLNMRGAPRAAAGVSLRHLPKRSVLRLARGRFDTHCATIGRAPEHRLRS